MKYVVNNHEMGLLFKNASYIRTLDPGVYRFMLWQKCHVMCLNMTGKFETGFDIALFLQDKKLCEKLDIISLRDNELALHYEDGNFIDILEPGTHAFFNTIKKHTFIRVDTSDPEVSAEIDRSIFEKEYFVKKGSRHVQMYNVPAGHAGVLFVNGDMVRTLAGGTYYFWKSRNKTEVKIFNIRKKLIEISGQELLSQDKVTLRINFTCQYRILDVVRASADFENYEEQIYTLLQLSLREYISTRKLDEILAEKHEIGKMILSAVKSRQSDFGAEFIDAGVKDVILPGDVREILNEVLIAEKKALANVITRREETASTRSLLNTAKLMEENQTLYRLKELEYIERICDKAGGISLNSGSGLLEQLLNITGSKK